MGTDAQQPVEDLAKLYELEAKLALVKKQINHKFSGDGVNQYITRRIQQGRGSRETIS